MQLLCAQKIFDSAVKSVAASKLRYKQFRSAIYFNILINNCSHLRRLTRDLIGWPRKYLMKNQITLNDRNTVIMNRIFNHYRNNKCSDNDIMILKSVIYSMFKKRLYLKKVNLPCKTLIDI